MTKLEEIARIIIDESYRYHGSGSQLGEAEITARAVIKALMEPTEEMEEEAADAYVDAIQAHRERYQTPAHTAAGLTYKGSPPAAWIKPVFNAMLQAILDEK